MYSNLIVQEYVSLKKYSEKTNEWRGWYFGGTLFELCPNSDQPPNAARPPEWLVEKYRSESPFFTLDFAELSDGDWLIIGSDDGQVSKLTQKQTARDFYRSFAKAVSDFPHLPEWIWCLVANVDDDATWTAPEILSRDYAERHPEKTRDAY